MRYELSDFEWAAIKPFLPNKPRGVPRSDDRKVLNGIYCCPSSDDSRHIAGFRKGGSGSSVNKIMRYAVDAASDGLRLSGA
jgi:hypothetical protein